MIEIKTAVQALREEAEKYYDDLDKWESENCCEDTHSRDRIKFLEQAANDLEAWHKRNMVG